MNYCYNMLVLRRKNPGKFITLTVSDTTVINVFVSLKKTNKQKENRYNNSIPHAELVLHPLFS